VFLYGAGFRKKGRLYYKFIVWLESLLSAFINICDWSHPRSTYQSSSKNQQAFPPHLLPNFLGEGGNKFPLSAFLLPPMRGWV